MRLLLDEHSPEIARQLRTRGHDVVAVAERADLVGVGDDELPARMARERRAIMTNNVKDLMPLASRATVTADHHSGLPFTSDRSLPRRSDTVGRLVRVLDGFLRRHPDEESYRNQAQWLSAEVTDDADGGL